MKAAYKTHIGCVRALNEDTGAVVMMDKYLLAIVADGMGGHQAGNVASLMSVDIIKMELANLPERLSPNEASSLLQRAIYKANRAIYDYAKNHDECHGMGTTVAVCLICEDWLVIGHIGDSRIYRVSGEEIKQLTEDHSLVNELVKNGQISKEEANHHPQRNVLIRALGTDSVVNAELRVMEWDSKDCLLICSDGLSNKVSPEKILRIIKTSATPEIAVSRLIDFALAAGGEDNITAIVIGNEGFGSGMGNEVT